MMREKKGHLSVLITMLVILLILSHNSECYIITGFPDMSHVCPVCARWCGQVLRVDGDGSCVLFMPNAKAHFLPMGLE